METDRSFHKLLQKYTILPESGLNEKEQFKHRYRQLSHENNIKTLRHFGNCEWMRKHGKGEFIDFNAKERAKIRSVFKELDKDCSGALSLDELYQPLLALGLVECKQQVREMMEKVDVNKSGLIEFEEFMKIIKYNGNEKNTLITFFKNLSKEEIFSESKDLPFTLMLSNKRRELMMQNYLGKNSSCKEQGKRVLTAFALELKEKEVQETKFEKLKMKKDSNLKVLLERKFAMKSQLGRQVTYCDTFITGMSRPHTASKRPMTRRDLLNLQ